MKVNKLETHDRLEHFKKDQEYNLFQGVNDCIKKNPDCLSMQEHFPYVYIFAHPRTSDDGYSKRMLWQPRLSKPKAQTNSYLFRYVPATDLVEIIWLLPPKEMWPEYEKGKMLESKDVWVSIQNFLHRRKELEMSHEDDWPEEKIRQKLKSIVNKKSAILTS